MEDNIIYIETEDGQEIAYEIILTFTHPDTEVNYVVYREFGEGEDVYAARYDEKNDIAGTLSPLESDEEYAMVQEVIDAFIVEEE